MSDRALQDQLIRYLTDAQQRGQGPGTLPLSHREAARANRFARFLARHYYRDRLAQSFRYSRTFRGQTGRVAEQVVDQPEFDSFLQECVLGSLAAARCVGDKARHYLAAGPASGPWWPELLEYEHAYFLQAATSEAETRSERPSRGISAVSIVFSWALPELLQSLREHGRIAGDLRRPVTLLFSRAEGGKIFVAEVEETVSAVFDAANGARTVEQIASQAGVSFDEANQILKALVGIGAVVLAA